MSRATLLAGTSVLALALATPVANARQPGIAATSSAATFATEAAQAASAQAAIIARQSQTALTRATQAIQSMQAVQAAARNAAATGANSLGVGLPAVTDGLSPGGLVPDSGLAAAGHSNAVSTWVGVSGPTQTSSNGHAVVTVTQSLPQALLNWQQFNIGKNTTLVFDQGGNTNFVALNQITDPSARPSQILGSIKADGSIYIINPNGIIFGGTSQINVSTLIASSLSLTNVTNFLNGTGIMSSGGVPSFSSVDGSGSPLYAAGAVTVQAGAQITAPSGNVLLLAPDIVNNGAISTPSGQTLLLGGTDVSLGTGDSYIRGFVVEPNTSTPLADGYSPVAANSSDPQLPVHNAFWAGGTVVNNGSISAPQGNITIVGGTVAQNGVLTSTTSTTANGSINVTAQTGLLTLGGVNDNPLYAQFNVAPQQSVVQIIPDPTDQTLVADTQAIANSNITLTGANVDLKGVVQLHGYDVTNVNDHPGGISIVATGSGANTIGQVLLEDGSLIDASGTTDANVSASRNSVPVELLSNELRDSPLVRMGPLYRATIYVDSSVTGTNADGTTWEGTPLGDASGDIALATPRSLEERMMNGAPITISGATVAYGSVAQTTTLPANLIQAAGSIINISGGFLTYTAGFVQVSTLVEADGRLVSASNAEPDVQYLGVCCSFTVDHSRWNVTDSYTSGVRQTGYEQASYIQGGAGGSLNLEVQSTILDGQLYANVLSGVKQRTAASAPDGASLLVNSTDLNTWLALTWGTAYNTDNIILSDGAASAATGWFALTSSDPTFELGTFSLNTLLTNNSLLANSVLLPSSWLNSGVTNVNFAANSNIVLPAGNPVTLPAFGSFSASANSVDVESAITVPSGTIVLTGAFTATSLSNADFTSLKGGNPNGTASPTSGLVTIGAGVTLSAAGSWTNDVTATSAAAIDSNGNTIDISSTNNIDIGTGSVLDVSGGGYESSVGKVSGGNGGTLTLAAGVAAPLTPYEPFGFTPTAQAPLGSVNFEGGLQAGQLKGYGVSSPSGLGVGGTLNITSVAALVNGAIDPVVMAIQAASGAGGALVWQASPVAEAGGAGVTYIPVYVSTDFFSSGGFQKTGLTAAGISLPAGVTLAPTVASMVINNSTAPSGTIASVAAPVALPSGIRPASSIILHSVGELWTSQALVVSPNAKPDTSVDLTFGLNIAGTIRTDPTGSVTLSGDQIALVSGMVNAPGGSITLSGGTYNNIANADGGILPIPLDGEGVWLTGQLVAKGTDIAVPQHNGTTYLDVLPGGQVSVSGGDVILAPGSLIDVSGSSGPSTLVAAGSSVPAGLFSAGVVFQPTAIASAAGSISISVVLGGVLEGDLLGDSGGNGAAGGSLSITQAAHGRNTNGFAGGFWQDIENTAITLQQSLQPGDDHYFAAAALLPGVNPGNSPIDNAHIYVSADMVENGGFASLTLNAPTTTGFVTFSGNTRLTLPNQLVINAGTIVVPDGAVETLNANYVQWNNNSSSSAQPGPGTGSLTFNANTLDLVGDLAVQGAATTTFNVGGDLRLNAVMNSGAVDSLQNGYSGSLLSSGDLVFDAGQIYPSTGTTFTLSSSTSITFEADGAPPAAPLSAGGVLNVLAPVIVQGGTVRAPGGTINLGGSGQSFQTGSGAPNNLSFDNNTPGTLATSFSDLTSIGILDFEIDSGPITFVLGQPVSFSSNGITLNGIVTSIQGITLEITATSLTKNGVAVSLIKGSDYNVTSWTLTAVGTNLNLSGGSLTSVALGSEAVPYGFVQNGLWYNPYLPNTPVALTAPPAKQISLSGDNVSVQSGAVVDASGGGDLYAGTFVPGTGGSTDIFTKPNMYAVMPGYTGLAPYDPTINTTGPSQGKQVYLSGVPGLPAGFYTLLPGIYAELPGAFLVNVQTSPGAGTIGATRSPIVSQTRPDGSYLASGYVVAPGAGTGDEHWSVFSVMSDTVARQYSEITDSYANTFFTAQAAASGTTVPRLPADAGQLSITAGVSLVFEGQGVFNHPNGLGGLADISGNQFLVVDSATRNAIDQGTVSIASFAPGSSPQIGGDGEAFVAQTSNSTASVTIGTGNQTFTTAKDLSIFDGQIVTVTDKSNPANSMTGTIASYDPVTGQLVLNVTQSTGAGVSSNWTITAAAAAVWKPIVLAAGDLDNLGVESLLLGGTRSLQTDGMHYTASASQIVIANSASDPLKLPDIQLIAVPEQQNATYFSNAANNPVAIELPSGVAGTGQVLVAQGAVIEASGAVAPGETPNYILAAPPMLGAAGANNGYTVSQMASYYQEIAANEISFLRLSGGGLVTTVGGAATYADVPADPSVGGSGYTLPPPDIAGSVSIGSGAQLIASDSLTIFGTGRIAPGVVISAQAAELKSSVINLGTDDFSLPGMVLNQAALDTLAGVKALTLVSTSTIDIDGAFTLGTFDPRGQPVLGSLTFDSAALVANSSGTATFNAEQVTFQNTLGGVAPVGVPTVASANLVVLASDVLGLDSDGVATGFNNATISLGTGAVTLAGFGGGVLLQSGGQIAATGDGGSLNVQSALTLDAPRITAGAVSVVDGVPSFTSVSYTIATGNNSVALINSGGTTPALPAALLGNSLTITGGATTIATDVALPGGAFNLTANGSIAVNSGANIDVSGQAIQYAEVSATIGGGNINLTSVNGAIAIASGASLNVGDVAGIDALNPSSAGTLSLSASTGGVTIAPGTLSGLGAGPDSSGSFVLDTNTLATSAETYDALAAVLVKGGFGNSWDIRARSGDIAMTSLTQARKVTVSTDTGSIDLSGTIDASGVTGGIVNLYAGANLIIESSAVINAHGTVADANGRGGQVWLAASQAGDQQGNLILNVGASIDVGADVANGIDSGPVLGGSVVFETSRTDSASGIMLAVNGGSFANFITNVSGESAWDGIVVVGDRTYTYNDPT